MKNGYVRQFEHTNHETTLCQQAKKVSEEAQELLEAVLSEETWYRVLEEAVDLQMANEKLMYMGFSQGEIDSAVSKVYEKNDARGYYDDGDDIHAESVMYGPAFRYVPVTKTVCSNGFGEVLEVTITVDTHSGNSLTIRGSLAGNEEYVESQVDMLVSGLLNGEISKNTQFLANGGGDDE